MEQDYRLATPSRGLWLLNMMLGVLASSFSIGISAMAGWQRAGSVEHRLMLGAVGVVAVLGVHLLPALLAPARTLVRILGSVLWVTLLVYVTYGHTGYYLAVVEQAGMQRVASLDREEPTVIQTPKRMRSVILADKAKLEAGYASMARLDCTDRCAGLRLRQEALKARIMAIDAEAEEVRRWQQAQDRMETRRAASQVEPAVAQLAARFGVSEGSVNLVTGAIFAGILEGLGCLCWYLVFLRRDSASKQAVTKTEAQADTTGVRDQCEAVAVVIADPEPLSELDLVVAHVSHEVSTGRLACSVRAIREYLRCGQGRATEVRRRLIAGGISGAVV